MTPAELWTIANERAKIERERARAEWQRTAWFAAQLINISGKSLAKGRHVRPDDLIKFKEDEEVAAAKVDMEKRRKEAEESFRFMKRKFWTKLKGASVEEIVVTGVTEEGAKQDDKLNDGERVKRWILRQ